MVKERLINAGTVVVTTWDDGYHLDLKLAGQLEKYGIRATFFIPVKSVGTQLTSDELISISEMHEVGSHSLTHRCLIGLDEEHLKKEIFLSKTCLKNMIGKEVLSFAYPMGLYDDCILCMVQESRYLCARTTLPLEVCMPSNRFAIGTTLEANRVPRLMILRFFRKFYRSIYPYFHVFDDYSSLVKGDWCVFAKRLFDLVYDRGGVFHLWGHSWVIDKNNDWSKLEEVLSYISNRPSVRYCSLGELVGSNPEG